MTLARLADAGFGPEQMESIEAALATAFDIRFVFNQWTLGAEFCTGTLGLSAFLWLFIRATAMVLQNTEGRPLGLISWPVVFLTIGLTGLLILALGSFLAKR